MIWPTSKRNLSHIYRPVPPHFWTFFPASGRKSASDGGRKKEIPVIIEWTLIWFFLVIISILTTRACSAYFPFLVTSKLYCEIRNQRLQKILISPYIDRTLTVGAACEDRNKLSFIGCAFFAVAIIMLTVGYIFLVGYRAKGFTPDCPCLYFVGRIFSAVFPAYIYFMPVSIILYRIDYYMGKRLKQNRR